MTWTWAGATDHVMVGPAGVFVLDTKHLNGDARVSHGVLVVRWREDPEDGYDVPRLPSALKYRSAVIARQLETHGLGQRALWFSPWWSCGRVSSKALF